MTLYESYILSFCCVYFADGGQEADSPQELGSDGEHRGAEQVVLYCLGALGQG